jgi:hypothetical protein
MIWDIILFACVVLALLSLVLPKKRDWRDPRTGQAYPEGKIKQPSWLLTVSLTHTELTGTTIKGVASGVLAWADRPNRITRHLKVSKLLEMFKPGGTFHTDPPNAVISSAGRVYIVELTGCTGSKDGLCFNYRSIDHIPPDLPSLESDVSKHCVITIDNCEPLPTSLERNALLALLEQVYPKRSLENMIDKLEKYPHLLWLVQNEMKQMKDTTQAQQAKMIRDTLGQFPTWALEVEFSKKPPVTWSGTAHVQCDSSRRALLPFSTRRNPISPQYSPQELRTIQYSFLSSVPHPTIDTACDPQTTCTKGFLKPLDCS